MLLMSIHTNYRVNRADYNNFTHVSSIHTTYTRHWQSQSRLHYYIKAVLQGTIFSVYLFTSLPLIIVALKSSQENKAYVSKDNVKYNLWIRNINGYANSDVIIYESNYLYCKMIKIGLTGIREREVTLEIYSGWFLRNF